MNAFRGGRVWLTYTGTPRMSAFKARGDYRSNVVFIPSAVAHPETQGHPDSYDIEREEMPFDPNFGLSAVAPEKFHSLSQVLFGGDWI